jgi:hypothetical protein
MQWRQKALALVGAVALGFGLTGGLAAPDSMDAELEVAACSTPSTFNLTDTGIDFGEVAVSAENGVATGSFNVYVNTFCNAKAWAIRISSTNFVGTNSAFTIPVSQFSVAKSGAMSKTLYPGMDSQLNGGVTALNFNPVPAVGASQGFVASSFQIGASAYYYGFPGAVYQPYTASLNLSGVGLVPNETYTATVTVDWSPNFMGQG